MSLYHHSVIFTTCVYLFRCEAFNRIIRNYNVHGNRQASSRDIAVKFSTIEHLRYLSDGGLVSGSRYMYIGLAKLLSNFFYHLLDVVKDFVTCFTLMLCKILCMPPPCEKSMVTGPYINQAHCER